MTTFSVPGPLPGKQWQCVRLRQYDHAMREDSDLKQGQIVEVEIERSGFEGRAVARLDGLVLFVKGAVPGDRVRALVQKKRRRYVEAVLHEIVKPSPHRIEALCPYFGVCGGCRWQELHYSKQIQDKRQHVIELFSRIAGLEVAVEETLAAPDPYYYRNKMEFSFGTRRWLTKEEISSGRTFDKSFVLGLHVPGRFDKLVDLKECHLPSPTSSQIVNRVRELAEEQEWTAYDCRKHTGFLRHLVIRSSTYNGEILVALVTSRFDEDRMGVFKQVLLEEFRKVKTIINTVNETVADITSGEEILLHGTGAIVERLHGLEFRITPSTFFQTNTVQAERLFEVIRDMVGSQQEGLLFDLYAGVGSVGLFLARYFRKVICFENSPQSVQLARGNSRINGIENVGFHTADAASSLSEEILRKYGCPDVIVVDPPRAGLSSRMVRGIISSGCQRLVYVSCNPSTQARDIGILKEIYRVEKVQPVDMFPQTPHIESVALLIKGA